MAYPDPQELLDDLPQSGAGVDVADATRYLNRWIDSLNFQPQTDRERAVADMVVESGARGQLEALQLRRSGFLPSREVVDLIERAWKLREEYNIMEPTPQAEEDAPTAYVEPTPF